MTTIATLDIELAANVIRIQKDLERIGGVVDKHMGGISKAAGMAQSALGAIGVGLSAAGMGAWIKGAIDAADAADDMASKLSISVEALTGLQYAAQMSGATQDDLTAGMRNLSKQIAEQDKAFEVLGIRTTDASGRLRSADAVMMDAADAFARLQDGGTETALAMRLFGKAGTELIPLLNEGRAGINRLTGEAQELGRVITSDTAKAAAEFNDNLDRLRASANGLGSNVARDIIPGLTQITQAMADAAREGGILRAIWVGLGGVGAAMFTDEFSSAKDKVKRLSKEITDLRNAMAKPSMFASADIDLLFGKGSGSYEQRITQKQAVIAAIMKGEHERLQAIEARAKAEQEAAKKSQSAEEARLRALLGGNAARSASSKAAGKVEVQAWTESQFAALDAWHEYERMNAVLAEQAPLREAEARAIEDSEKAKRDEIERAAEAIAWEAEEAQHLVETWRQVAEVQAEYDRVAAEQQRKQIDEQASVWKSIESTAHDTFISIFDSGKSAFDRLRDTLKNGLLDLLYQMTVKKWIINISAAMGGSAVSSAAFAGTGGLSGGGDLLGLLGNLTSADGLGIVAGGLAESLGVSSATAGMIGSIASWALPVAGIAALLGGIFGGQPSNRSAWGTVDLASNQNLQFGNQTGDKQAAAETIAARDSLASAISQFSDLLAGLGASEVGRITVGIGERDGIAILRDAVLNAQGVGSGGTMLASGTDAAEVLRAALLAMTEGADGLSDSARTLLLNASGSSAQLIAVAQGMIALRESLPALEESFRALYYTEAENLAYTTEQLAAQFAGLNQALPESKDGFRALIEGIDQTTEQGLALYASLLQLGQPFADLIAAQEALAASQTSLAAETVEAASSVSGAIAEIADSVSTLTWEGVQGEGHAAAANFWSRLTDIGGRLTGDFGGVSLAQIAALRAEAQRMQAELAGFMADSPQWQQPNYAGRIAYETQIADMLAQADRLQGALGRWGGLSAQYGQDAASRILELDEWYAQAMQTAGSLAPLIQQAYDEQFSAIVAAADAVGGLRDQWLSIAEGIDSYLGGLALGNLSTLSPAEQLAQAQAQYQDTLEAALGGDVTAAGSLTGAAQAYLDQARQYYASGMDYAAIFAAVNTQLGDLSAGIQTGGPDIGASLATLVDKMTDLPALIAQYLGPRITERVDAGTAVDAAGYQLLAQKLDVVATRLDAIERRTVEAGA